MKLKYNHTGIRTTIPQKVENYLKMRSKKGTI